MAGDRGQRAARPPSRSRAESASSRSPRSTARPRLVISGDRGGRRGDPRQLGGAGQEDQAPRRLPRLPLAPDRADAARSSPRLRPDLTSKRPEIPIVSNLTGELLSAEQATDPAYWVPPRCASRCASPSRSRPCTSQGARAFLELGPDPVLCAMARGDAGGGRRSEAAFARHPARGTDEAEALRPPLADAHAAGAQARLGGLLRGHAAPSASPLPTYPFQRKRYWLASSAGAADAARDRPSDRRAPAARRRRSRTPTGEGLTLTGRISLATHPWLADHAVAGTVLLPGTAFLELALQAAEQVGAESVEELTLQAPLVLPERGSGGDPGLGLRPRRGGPARDRDPLPPRGRGGASGPRTPAAPSPSSPPRAPSPSTPGPPRAPSRSRSIPLRRPRRGTASSTAPPSRA